MIVKYTCQSTTSNRYRGNRDNTLVLKLGKHILFFSKKTQKAKDKEDHAKEE